MADQKSAMVPIREKGNVTLKCPKLTESNYTTWSILMEQILKAYGLWDVVSTTGGVEVGEKKKTATTKAMIFQTFPEDILMQVAQYPRAKKVWYSIKWSGLRQIQQLPTRKEFFQAAITKMTKENQIRKQERCYNYDYEKYGHFAANCQALRRNED
ncbi:hypothetical protein E3N88_00445 [Mikania micrantha]|uniref:DUF4219 domain-containing protein n=1 Tax=Mikania micrantha TaxID=192012 RepID=A0A5N6PY57_9ASTR|nr:hypothetical protein E3N88_00445 [Mikania micrantha]